MKLPRLNTVEFSRIMTQFFRGLNHNARIADGEWYDEKNLSSSQYPLLSQRRKRGIWTQLTAPQGMLAKDAMAYVDDGKLYYNGYLVSGVDLAAEGEKQMVSMGAYLVIFPDKVYVNTQDLSDCGSLEATYDSVEGANITYQMCRVDGTAYEVSDANVSATEPVNPENGAYWIDSSQTPHSLKQYSATNGAWVAIASTYIRIGCTGIGAAFAQYDGVTVSGCAYAGENAVLAEQMGEINGEKLIYARDEDSIVVAGVLDQAYTQTAGTVTVKRQCPDMQYVCEGENRIWGCFYGMREGKMLNEIYACALGDFKNWNRFMGISTDSYAVSVGSDGAFSGAISFTGYPHFFKENCLHKIYGQMPANYQVQTTPLRGVQEGSHKSMVVVNEILYYKSRSDVCAFDGSLPAGISSALGQGTWYDAAGGRCGEKYYLSMRDAAGAWTMYVYDVQRGIWHKEDETRAMCFAQMDDDLYYIDADTNRMMAVNGTQGEAETEVEWFAESGLFGYEYENHKYLSRFNIRMKLEAGARAALYIEYDSSGKWELQGEMQGAERTRTFLTPVIPRRCDHMRLKIVGRGDVKLYSIARLLTMGGDGR